MSVKSKRTKIVKIRLNHEKEKRTFEDLSFALKWVRENRDSCVVSVLTYENDSLEDLTRWLFNGRFFRKEEFSS